MFSVSPMASLMVRAKRNLRGKLVSQEKNRRFFHVELFIMDSE